MPEHQLKSRWLKKFPSDTNNSLVIERYLNGPQASSVLQFNFRYHRIGVLVLFLHDVNDVFLEFCKLCVAFKTRNGKYHIVPDILSNVGFLCFTFLW